MTRMIKDLLDLGRARLGTGIPVRAQQVDIVALAQRAVDEVRTVHVDIVVDVDAPAGVQGNWDADRLEQLLSNLLHNAVEHGVAGRPIHLRVRDDKDHVVIVVANTGAIAADALPHVFDPFRSGALRGKPSEGLGLGLYIVMQIALAHGGAVEAATRGDETEFIVRLPKVGPPPDAKIMA
jgi:signal transduction histidine kinase